MKILGIAILVVGVVLLTFAVLSYRELNAAARSGTSPNPNELPLTKIVGPELFEPSTEPVKPSDLARLVINRIYMIGSGAFLLGFLGILLLAISPKPKHLPDDN